MKRYWTIVCGKAYERGKLDADKRYEQVAQDFESRARSATDDAVVPIWLGAAHTIRKAGK